MAFNSTSPASQPPVPLKILQEDAVKLYGPYLIGSFLNVLLYGIFLMQLTSYWGTFRSDASHIKLLVMWMTLLATTVVCLTIACSYTRGVISFGNLSALLGASKIANVVIICLGISGPTAQIFYGTRIWRLTKRLWIPAFIWSGAIAELGCCVYIAAKDEIVRLWSESSDVTNAVIALFALSLVTDIAMSATQVYYLEKCRTGFSQTDEIGTHLNRLILQTGTITCVNAVLMFALYRYGLSHQAATHMIAAFPMATLYLNCVMSNLNGRRGTNAVLQTVCLVHKREFFCRHPSVNLAFLRLQMRTGETASPVKRTHVQVTTRSATTDQDIELGSSTGGEHEAATTAS